jgi:RNA polymerase sigma-70 factor (ECF subfamily)
MRGSPSSDVSGISDAQTVNSEALFIANRHRLFRYFVRAVGEVEAARDLTQDVFVRVSRSTIPAGGDGEVKAWLFQIARNLALDHYRKHGRRPAVVALADHDSRPASQDVGLAVHEALTMLSDVDRDVFLMREVAGLSYDEISRACDLTSDAVRSRIHRARLQLRAQLAAPVAARRTIPMRQSGRDPE